MKTSDLTGAALDWAVAKCEGWPMDIWYDEDQMPMIRDDEVPEWKPSTDWAQGGPIIEREKIDLFTEKPTNESWIASVARHQNGLRLTGWRLHQYGPTPLSAAMRCYVSFRLGDTVEVPDELA